MERSKKKIIDLGWENGWHDEPSQIKEAKAKGFISKETKHDCRACVTWYEIETDTEILTWKVDSSD